MSLSYVALGQRSSISWGKVLNEKLTRPQPVRNFSGRN
jgi:hypothetical protein